MKIQSVKDVERIGQQHSRKLYTPDAVKVNIGMASCGIAAGAQAAFDAALEKYPGNNGVNISRTGCIGFCEMEPLVEILQSGGPRIVYKKITANKIEDVIEGYRNNDFDLKRILGQMKDPRSLLENDIDNPLDSLAPIDGIPILEDR
jgi:(2Fe-2S) ferredoxin